MRAAGQCCCDWPAHFGYSITKVDYVATLHAYVSQKYLVLIHPHLHWTTSLAFDLTTMLWLFIHDTETEEKQRRTQLRSHWRIRCHGGLRDLPYQLQKRPEWTGKRSTCKFSCFLSSIYLHQVIWGNMVHSFNMLWLLPLLIRTCYQRFICCYIPPLLPLKI